MRGQGGDARSNARTYDLDRGKLRPMLGDGEADSSWSGRLLPAFGEHLLVGRRREFLAGRVPPAGVVVLDPGRDRSQGLRPRRCTRLPRSVCRTTPGTAPPRAATAIASAPYALPASRCSPSENRGTRREAASITEAILWNLNCRNYPFLTCRTSTIGSRVAVGREPIWCGVAPRPWRHAGKQTHRLGCGRARDASLSRRVAAGVRAELADSGVLRPG